MTRSAVCIAILAALLNGCGSDSGDDDPAAAPLADQASDPVGSGAPGVDPGAESGDDGSVAMPGDGPVPDGSRLITSDTYETILREIVPIADDRTTDAASASVDPLFTTLRGLVAQALASGAASGDGLVFVSDEARGSDNESERAVTFSCGDGGTLVVEALVYDDLPGSPFVSGFSAGEGCAIGGDLHAGRAFKLVRIVRGTDIEAFEGFSITRADGDSLSLDGDYSDSAPEGRGPGVDTGWSDTDLLVVEAGETTRVDGYDSSRRSVTYTGPGGTPGASADVSFSVTAPWSAGERLDVTVDLAFDWAPDPTYGGGEIPGQQWQSGTLRVVAPDGSGLTLSPGPDSATFSVTIDGDGTGPIVREWSDGFQLACPTPFVCG